MRQRLGIAQALVGKPAVILLDEPVSALDPIGRKAVLELMEGLKGETTVFYSTHILERCMFYDQYWVVMELLPEYQRDLSAMNLLHLTGRQGVSVPLGSLAKVTRVHRAAHRQPLGPAPLRDAVVQPPAGHLDRHGGRAGGRGGARGAALHREHQLRGHGAGLPAGAGRACWCC